MHSSLFPPFLPPLSIPLTEYRELRSYTSHARTHAHAHAFFFHCPPSPQVLGAAAPVQAGPGQLIILEGNIGVGKTTLARQLAAAVREEEKKTPERLEQNQWLQTFGCGSMHSPLWRKGSD